jgi:hypothetical protein
MAKGPKQIELNGRAYEIQFGWNAIRRIEEYLGIPIQAVGARMTNNQAGVRELGIVFWAALETARLKTRNRPQPWTVDEVGDLIDEIGSDVFFEVVYPQVLDAFIEAFPGSEKKEKAGAKDTVDPQ